MTWPLISPARRWGTPARSYSYRSNSWGRHALAMNVSGSGFTGRIRRLLGGTIGYGHVRRGLLRRRSSFFASMFLAIQLTGREEGGADAGAKYGRERAKYRGTAPSPAPPHPRQRPMITN